jgi:trehalose 6-phosphate phosphatase
LLGLHGWEGREVPPLPEERRLIRTARQRFDERFLKTLKVWLEDKGLGLAVHYRGVPLRAVRRARAIVGDVLRTIGPQIHMVRGHKVWELLPRQIDGKGPAVIELLSKLPQPTLPIFVGDDMTDESAFTALRRGLTIHVGASRHSKARFLLRNPEEVKMFLLKLEVALA